MVVPVWVVLVVQVAIMFLAMVLLIVNRLRPTHDSIRGKFALTHIPDQKWFEGRCPGMSLVTLIVTYQHQ